MFLFELTKFSVAYIQHLITEIMVYRGYIFGKLRLSSFYVEKSGGRKVTFNSKLHLTSYMKSCRTRMPSLTNSFCLF